MTRPSMVRCKSFPSCDGSLGAWVDGAFHPAPHLRAGRDIWVSEHGSVHLRCPLCRAEHVLRADQAGRLGIRLDTPAPTRN